MHTIKRRGEQTTTLWGIPCSNSVVFGALGEMVNSTLWPMVGGLVLPLNLSWDIPMPLILLLLYVPGANQHPYYRVRPRHRGQAAKEKSRQRAKHFQEKQRQEQEAAASPLPPQPPSSISSTISSCTSSVLPPSSPPPQPPTPPASSVPCVPQPGAPPMASPSLSIPALTPNSPSTPFYGFPTPQAPSSRDRKKRPPLSSHHFPHSLESPHFLLHLRKWLGPRTGNLWQWKIILYFCSFCICA